MKLQIVSQDFSVCKLRDLSGMDGLSGVFFAAKTDEECSLVCSSRQVPENATHISHGWKAFRVEGVLDFSLIGILSKISSLLAGEEIGIFAVSTYNTDYILTREEDFEKAIAALLRNGYEVEK